MKVKSESESEFAQLCPTLSDPMDCSPPGSSIHGIFQASVQEWGAIAFSILATCKVLNHVAGGFHVRKIAQTWNLSTIKKVLLETNSQTQRTNSWFLGGKDVGEGIVREFGIYTYTLLYLKWMTNKDLLCSSGNSAQCPVAAWMEGEFGAGWVHVHIWPSFFAVPLKLLQHY